ncbi:hypothetical protein ACF0H5_016509 [Mactra antiquata]
MNKKATFITALLLVVCVHNSSATLGDIFAWGVSSSAYQSEGGWNAEGKGESIWDTFTHANASKDNGDESGEGYKRYTEHLPHLVELKVTHYRFSVAWSRVLPKGTKGTRNNAGIQYYKNLVNELKSRGIEPVVTLYDHDLPQALQDVGGWKNNSIVDVFGEYANLMFTELGDSVKHWVTFNEPAKEALAGYEDGTFAPGLKESANSSYEVAHNMIRAHVRAYRLYQNVYKATQKGLVGINLNADWSTSMNSAAQRGMKFYTGWFADPIFGNGDYPAEMKSSIGSDRLPAFTQAEITDNGGSSDFFGVTYGKTYIVSDGSNDQFPEYSYANDMDITLTESQDSVETSLKGVLKWLKMTYSNPELYVFDGGYGDCGTLYDEDRIQYMKKSMVALRKSIREDGVRVGGYFAAQLIDGFDWTEGYKVKYGLYHLELGNKERIQKASARYYMTLIENKGEEFSYPAHFVPDIIREKDIFLREQFPRNFAWGAATAAYQIEGAYNEDGKGPSFWDTFANNGGLAFQQTGNVACDSYHQYKRDVQMLVELGVSHYRFSISWSRVLPNGRAESLNQLGVDYYNNLINELRANNIVPMATLYHWDLPQALDDIGGWENETIIDYFNDYARICFEQFGDRVPLWLTFNEAYVVTWLGYGIGIFPPNEHKAERGVYNVAHNIVRSHVKVYHLYDKQFRQHYHGRVGITLDCDWKEPATTGAMDRYAAERALQFKLGWFANPIYGNGDYPAEMKHSVAKKSRDQGLSKSRLPEFTEEEKKMNKGANDFFGLNHYTTQYIRDNYDNRNNYEGDQNLYTKVDDCWPGSTAGWLKVNPWGLRGLLRWIRDRYNNPPLFVTENGVGDDGTLHDQSRIDYYTKYTNEMLKAIKWDGCNVVGYMAWSLMDNLEWTSGYTVKFGLYNVNFTDPARTRTPKDSARWYSNLVRTNGYN